MLALGVLAGDLGDDWVVAPMVALVAVMADYTMLKEQLEAWSCPLLHVLLAGLDLSSCN
jgi:hypothetical protein